MNQFPSSTTPRTKTSRSRQSNNEYEALLHRSLAAHRNFLGACVIAGASIIVNVILLAAWGSK